MNAQINVQSQCAKLIWFTGLSGAGKTTLSNALHAQLALKGVLSVVLDGDIIRKTVNSDLGFSLEDRTENLRRVAEISRLFLNSNFVVIGAFISPLESDRGMIKNIVGADKYIEIYVNTPLEICEQRDVKGLYKRARKNEIKDFTGLSSLYEPPSDPDLTIDTSKMSITECVDLLMSYLWPQLTL